jgi:hypothetical protein
MKESMKAKVKLPLESAQRDALIGRIVQRLNDLDDQSLLRLAETVREPEASPEIVAESIEQTVSRRRFMMALLGGGALATTAGAVAAWQWGAQNSGLLVAQVRQLTDEIERLLGLLGLYQKLDEVPIDDRALTGLKIVGASLGLAAGAARLVRDGAQIVKDALRRFEASLPRIRASLAWLEGLLMDLSSKLHLLEDAIGRALDQVSQITDALGAFFDTLLGLLPFGMGEKAREALDRINDLISSIPQLIENLNLNILIPLREEWFSDEKGKGLTAWLIEPLITRLLDPIEALMDRVAALNTSWDRDLNQPVAEAIRQRATLRQEIADYKARYRLQESAEQMLARSKTSGS